MYCKNNFNTFIQNKVLILYNVYLLYIYNMFLIVCFRLRIITLARAIVWNDGYGWCSRIGAGVVNGTDLKSVGLWPHRFESCSIRIFCFTPSIISFTRDAICPFVYSFVKLNILSKKIADTQVRTGDLLITNEMRCHCAMPADYK